MACQDASIRSVLRKVLHRKVIPPVRVVSPLSRTQGTFPAVIKESLNLLGIDAGPCMEPAGPMTNEEREKLRKVLIEMQLLK